MQPGGDPDHVAIDTRRTIRRIKVESQQRVLVQKQLAHRQRTDARPGVGTACGQDATRSEEHTSELQSLMRISYAVFCLKKKNTTTSTIHISQQPSSTTSGQPHTHTP